MADLSRAHDDFINLGSGKFRVRIVVGPGPVDLTVATRRMTSGEEVEIFALVWMRKDPSAKSTEASDRVTTPIEMALRDDRSHPYREICEMASVEEAAHLPKRQ